MLLFSTILWSLMLQPSQYIRYFEKKSKINRQDTVIEYLNGQWYININNKLLLF